MEKNDQKYSKAIELYRTTKLSIREISKETNIKFSVLTHYISTYHSDVIIARYDSSKVGGLEYKVRNGQNIDTYYKYREAVAACDSAEFIEYNISQIASVFGVGCSSLANHLRRYYPDIVPRREQIRGRLGINTNLQYGVRKKSKEKYSEAVKILQNTDMAIEEVANLCNVPYAGFREHILAYYPQVTQQRKVKREDAKGQSVKGKRSGNWAIHKPNEKTVEKYTKAVKLYETTSMTIDNIARVVGVNSAALRHYLKAWHPDLIIRRRGYEDGVALSQTKRYNKATADKYAEAIDLFRNKDLSIASIASELGLNYESLRRYLKEHYPELSCGKAMAPASNVKHMPNRNASKY